MPKDNSDSAASRIRYYVYGVIRKNSDSSVQIPSSYELARMFETSRRVAQYELERLIAEGVLIGKKRVGTFTNPMSSYSRNVTRDAMPLIGVTYGSGDHFTYAHEGAFSISAVYKALGEMDCFIHDLRLPNKNPESMLRDILSVKLDGLIWLSPDNEFSEHLFEKLAEANCPLVTCGAHLFSAASGVRYAFNDVLMQLSDIMRKEQRKKVFVVDFLRSGFPEDLSSLSCIPGVEITRFSSSDFLGLLEDKLAAGIVPDICFCESINALEIQAVLERHGIDCKKGCRLVALREFSHSNRFTGYIVRRNYTEAAKTAIWMLLEQIGKKQPKIRHNLSENSFSNSNL